ncbi:MAG: 3-isopropylmalate dehydratase small subunit [Proteobacteria bacterium]|nr:3-isopropylmalate dehydratase small subunit [Pseudomonadota bacterium]
MKMKKLSGPSVRVGDHIDTDTIIPARYLSSTDSKLLAAHCLELLDAKTRDRIHAGIVLVAGSNFGCGSSREHAPLALKARGILAVVAKSFARIFFRNGINLGLPLIEIPAAIEIPDGEEIELDFAAGKIEIPATKKVFTFPPLPGFVGELLEAGGLLAYLKAGGKLE